MYSHIERKYAALPKLSFGETTPKMNSDQMPYGNNHRNQGQGANPYGIGNRGQDLSRVGGLNGQQHNLANLGRTPFNRNSLSSSMGMSNFNHGGDMGGNTACPPPTNPPQPTHSLQGIFETSSFDGLGDPGGSQTSGKNNFLNAFDQPIENTPMNSIGENKRNNNSNHNSSSVWGGVSNSGNLPFSNNGTGASNHNMGFLNNKMQQSHSAPMGVMAPLGGGGIGGRMDGFRSSNNGMIMGMDAMNQGMSQRAPMGAPGGQMPLPYSRQSSHASQQQPLAPLLRQQMDNQQQRDLPPNVYAEYANIHNQRLKQLMNVERGMGTMPPAMRNRMNMNNNMTSKNSTNNKINVTHSSFESRRNGNSMRSGSFNGMQGTNNNGMDNNPMNSNSQMGYYQPPHPQPISRSSSKRRLEKDSQKIVLMDSQLTELDQCVETFRASLSKTCVGNWRHNDADFQQRRDIILRIAGMIQFSNEGQMGRSNGKNSVPYLAKKLEECLYRTARTKEDYSDYSTLRDRLKQIINSGKSRRVGHVNNGNTLTSLFDDQISNYMNSMERPPSQMSEHSNSIDPRMRGMAQDLYSQNIGMNGHDSDKALLERSFKDAQRSKGSRVHRRNSRNAPLSRGSFVNAHRSSEQTRARLNSLNKVSKNPDDYRFSGGGNLDSSAVERAALTQMDKSRIFMENFPGKGGGQFNSTNVPGLSDDNNEFDSMNVQSNQLDLEQCIPILSNSLSSRNPNRLIDSCHLDPLTVDEVNQFMMAQAAGYALRKMPQLSEKAVQQQQHRLLLLRHSSKCQNGPSCRIPACYKMVDLWKHLRKCNDPNCKVSHCNSSRLIINHFIRCKETGSFLTCNVCGPVAAPKSTKDLLNLNQARQILERNRQNAGNPINSVSNANLSSVPKGHHDVNHLQQPSSSTIQQVDSQLKEVQSQHTLNSNRRPIDNHKKDDNTFGIGATRLHNPLPEDVPSHQLDKDESNRQSSKQTAVVNNSPSQKRIKINNDSSDEFNVDRLYTHLNSTNKNIDRSTHLLSFKNNEDYVKFCLPVVEDMINHPDFGWIFSEPVDPLELDIPDYLLVVKNPMDLSTVKSQLLSGQYKNLESFEADVKLVFQNAILYNGEDSDVGNIAKQGMETFVKRFTAALNGLQSIEDDNIKCTICGEHRKDEELLQCSKCTNWVYGICSLNTDSQKEDKITCMRCVLNEHGNNLAKVKDFFGNGVHDIPHCDLSKDIEDGLRKKIDCQMKNMVGVESASSLNSSEVSVRLVGSWVNSFSVAPEVRKICPQYATHIPYRRRTIALFQTLEGIDTLVFLMFVDEYENKCPLPNRGKVLISFLDSLPFFQPAKSRSGLFHNLVVEYLRNAGERGFQTAHIWACPPSPVGLAFFRRPDNQGLPPKTKLREWFWKLLHFSSGDQKVYSLYEYLQSSDQASNLNDRFFFQLPYFENDYISSEMENVCKSNEHLSVERLMQEILLRLQAEGQSLIVVPLKNSDQSEIDGSVEEGGNVDSEIFRSQYHFFLFCEKNNLQFSDLRKAKHSSVSVIYQLKQGIPDLDRSTFDGCSKKMAQDKREKLSSIDTLLEDSKIVECPRW